MSYTPRGKMINLLAAMHENPSRLFTVKDTAQLLCCKPFPSTIDMYVGAAAAANALFRINLRGEWLYAGEEITDQVIMASGRAPRSSGVQPIVASPTYTVQERETARSDARAPGASGFVPKAMGVPRPGSDQPIPKFAAPAAPAGKREEKNARILADVQKDMEPRGERAHRLMIDRLKVRMPHWDGKATVEELGKRTASEATASSHGIPDSTSTPEPVAAAGPGQERHTGEHRHPAGSSEGCDEVANTGDARAASGGSAQPEEEEDVEAEFNIAYWLDGDVVIYGAQVNEDGSFTLTAEQAAALRRFLPGAPAQ